MGRRRRRELAEAANEERLCSSTEEEDAPMWPLESKRFTKGGAGPEPPSPRPWAPGDRVQTETMSVPSRASLPVHTAPVNPVTDQIIVTE